MATGTTAEHHGWTKFVSLQPQYNLIYREEEREIADACPNAKVLDGLAIVGKSAQNDFPAVQKDVDAWLSGLDY